MPERVCVIGAGLAGSLLAWRLAQASAAWEIDLVLGTRQRVDATAASGGAVRAYESHPEQRRLAAASMMELLASQTLREWADYRRLGSVYLLATGNGSPHHGAAHDGSPHNVSPVNGSPGNDSHPNSSPGNSPRGDVSAGNSAAGDSPPGSGQEGAGGAAAARTGQIDLAAQLAEIETMLPGSCRLAGADELEALGWQVPAGVTAVLEHHAGYVSPGGLRDRVLADEAVRRRVRAITGQVRSITPVTGGAVRCELDSAEVPARDYDVVVVAAGSWTGALLRASGLPATDYRTKSIQYSLYTTGEWRPPHFVDEVTGLYGRPGANGDLLLGLPTTEWDIDPDHPPTTPPLHEQAARLAQQRFPRLRLGGVTHQVGSSDCYAGAPVLALRPVVNHDHRLFTFSGGAGGSVKTALAASHRAAIQLVESDPSPHPDPSDTEKVTP